MVQPASQRTEDCSNHRCNDLWHGIELDHEAPGVQGDDDVAVETITSPAVRVRQRLKGDKAELSWLMRTTYISNDGDKQARCTALPRGQRPCQLLQTRPTKPRAVDHAVVCGMRRCEVPLQQDITTH